MERIVATAPGFRTRWETFVKEWGAGESWPWYVAMGELAHYVVESYVKGATGEFPSLFATVETLLVDEPDPALENLIAVGLFEDIQNVSSHRHFGAAVFRQWLGTRSLKVWDEVEKSERLVERARKQPRWWQLWRRRKHFDPEKALSQVENVELRKIIESTYRKKQ